MLKKLNTPHTALLAAIAAGLLFAPAMAQETGRKDKDRGMQDKDVQDKGMTHDRHMRTGQTHRILKADELIGKEVKSPQDEDLGQIEDIVVDHKGRIEYAVLSFGGFLGLGEKYFAIPWNQFSTRQDEVVQLNIDKKRLENAPGFNKDNWPDMASSKWRTQVHEHYGVDEDWIEQDAWHDKTNRGEVDDEYDKGGQKDKYDKDRSKHGGEGMAHRDMKGMKDEPCRISKMMGKDVKNARNEPLGEVENFAIDPDNGRIAYSVLSLDKVDGAEDKLFAVPYKALDARDDGSLTLDMPKERLKNAPSFKEDNWPKRPDRQWMSDMYSFYNVQEDGQLTRDRGMDRDRKTSK